MRTYKIEFTEDQWQELFYMSFEPFEFVEGEDLTHGQWMALGEMALGKAQRIEEGAYPDEKKRTAKELRKIAKKIFDHLPAEQA